ncbi:MAG TPA: hypothetical protein VHY91_11015 [Pirellulales bacterium]|jgi:hypothetical protein|nr:hypothetical protein [Pirellulales bacterium]
MDREYGNARYSTCKVEDPSEGYVGFDLLRSQSGKKDRVARILFWDADGQFSLETCGTDVPLGILEELIAEAKGSMKAD